MSTGYIHRRMRAERHALGAQKRILASRASEGEPGRQRTIMENDPMARYDARLRIAVKDAPDGTGGTRTSGQFGHLTIRRHKATRNMTDHIENCLGEGLITHDHQYAA
ncbi:hypothetical protein BMIN_0656 [Bifidobacterium minimum]|uniref:Transposase n=1 Tax=Bifidobacterium minimum TaxID=1693 RepID=A0A087BQD2_9BIFI|nr:hypothetical protein BMIN_0656 [Bifidobacterium minimum]